MVHEDLPAFPYSPAHTEHDVLYEFAMNYPLHLAKPMDSFTLIFEEVVHGKAG